MLIETATGSRKWGLGSKERSEWGGAFREPVQYTGSRLQRKGTEHKQEDGGWVGVGVGEVTVLALFCKTQERQASCGPRGIPHLGVEINHPIHGLSSAKGKNIVGNVPSRSEHASGVFERGDTVSFKSKML